MKNSEPQSTSYVFGPIDLPLIEKTVGTFFDEIATKYAGSDAIVSRHQGVRLTYEKLKTLVDELAIALLGFGVHQGDRVGIWSPNNW